MMNPWNTYVLPRMTDRLLGTPTVGQYRKEVSSSLSGEIVEIGYSNQVGNSRSWNTVCAPTLVCESGKAG